MFLSFVSTIFNTYVSVESFVMKTNVDGVSIISAISYSDNIEKTVREMIEQF